MGAIDVNDLDGFTDVPVEVLLSLSHGDDNDLVGLSSHLIPIK